MKFNTLLWEVDAGILTLTLNRPEQMNSFTVEMANELIAAFGAASEDDSVRAIVVTGAGRAFCAGMDLSRAGNVFGLQETLEPTMDDMPRVAPVHGPPTPSGMQLVPDMSSVPATTNQLPLLGVVACRA